LTVEKGIEPRDFALVAFGGAGPMHAVFLARELGVPEVIVPPFPGAFSAWGMLETEIRKDFSRAYFTTLAALDRVDLARILSELEAEGFDALAVEGITRDTGRVEHALDIRYVGQEYTLTIPVLDAGEPARDGFAAAIADRFHTAHQARFGHANPGAPIEFVVARAVALGDLGRIEPARQAAAADRSYPFATAEVIFGRRAQPTAIVARDDLPIGADVPGPAIVSEATATTVVPPGATLRVDDFGALVIAAGEEQE
jgi:N-methylhydantoinase A